MCFIRALGRKLSGAVLRGGPFRVDDEAVRSWRRAILEAFWPSDVQSEGRCRETVLHRARIRIAVMEEIAPYALPYA